MALNSKIEWTHDTVNLVHGCTNVCPACDKCYAESTSTRRKYDVWGYDKYRRLINGAFKNLDIAEALAKKEKTKRRVFIGSMMDIFEKPRPMIDSKGNVLRNPDGSLRKTDELRNKLFANISNGDYPNLIFLLLTKRPSNINKYIPAHWKVNPPTNVMFGTSVCDQKFAKTYINHLVKVNGYRFLSVEPQLDWITLMPWLKNKSIHWVINGGESGPGKRPFNTDWARKLKAECKATGTPFFFKQVDKVQPIPPDLEIHEFFM